MESLAYIHNAVAYESNEPLPEMQVALPSSAWIATSSLMLSLLILGLPQDALATVTGVVRTGGSPLNIRNAPNGSVVTTVQDGATLELTGQTQGGWLETTEGNWVMSQFVESAPTPAAAAPEGSDPNAQQQATAAPRLAYVNTNGASLNVRSEPNGPIVRTVNNGSELQLSGRSNSGWLETADGNWVVSQYIQSTPPNSSASGTGDAAQGTPTAQAPDSAASPAPTGGQVGVVTTGGSPLNIRQTPGGEVVGQLQDGSQVQLTGQEQDGWVERTDGTWLQADFVERSPQTTAQSPSPTPETTAQSPSPTPETTAQSPAASPSPAPAPQAAAPAPAPSPAPQPATQAPVPAPAPNPAPQATAQAPAPAPSPAPQATAQAPANAPAATGSDVQAAVVQTNGSPLLVRRSPGGAVVGSLPNGASVELTGRSDGQWVERTNGTWVSSNWISTSGSPNPQPPVGNPSETAFVSTNGSPLNVRSTPGGAVIGTLPNGARVELTGRNDGQWVERTNSTWISGDWISTSDSPTPEPPVGNPATTAFVATNGSPLNVRRTPGGVVIGVLSNGSRVELTGRSDGQWVERTNGTWVSNDWLSSGPSVPPDVGGPDAIAVVDTNGSPLLVRNQPAGAIVGQLSNGTRITLNGRTSGDWSQLSSGDWVSSDWIVVLSR
ncbi:MAG: hypothetical protein AAFX78_17165 [Cyanobacteria bacterium J06638_20]